MSLLVNNIQYRDLLIVLPIREPSIFRGLPSHFCYHGYVSQVDRIEISIRRGLISLRVYLSL